MKALAFEVVIEKDRFEDGREAYHAYCPALKGCRTWGYTYSQAVANIREVVEMCVDELRESGAPLPSGPNVVELESPTVVVNL